MEEDSERESKKVELDWSVLLPPSDDGPPHDLVITTAGAGAGAAERKNSPVGMDGDQQEHCLSNEFSGMTDRELDVAINRKKDTYKTMRNTLRDKGAKILTMLKGLEAEKERRRRNPVQKDKNGCTELKQSEKPTFSGTSDGLRQDGSSSVPSSQSTFATHFSKKLEDNDRTVDAFDEEFSCMGFCGRRRNINSSPREPNKNMLSVRKSAFRCPTKVSAGVKKDLRANGEQRGGPRRPCSPCHSDGKVSSFSKKRKESQVMSLRNLRQKSGNIETVDLDEEHKPVDMFEEADELDECLKDTKTYYPSRDDQDPIEICYSDMEHLKPEAYLSSTIMNFYIRYLQLSPSTEREMCDYHFFSTYFYSKLVKAVSNKSDKESSFVKFRRWWKGVNIFDKAYILLPIHEHLHWSLIIICIPDKEDDTGPVILHLDSLGLHSSKQIFDNVKSFLKEEWKYLNEGESPVDHPFAERIWTNLPRRIEERTIPVPQQRNEYDCGLFVLFFMERFIAEAPQRLKRNDLSMFGNRWFKPEEASNLRRKIWSLMKGLLTASTEKCDPVVQELPLPPPPPGDMITQPIDC